MESIRNIELNNLKDWFKNDQSTEYIRESYSEHRDDGKKISLFGEN